MYKIKIVAILAILLAVGPTTSQSLAQSTSLGKPPPPIHVTLLLPSDLPSGYSKPTTTVFTRFTPKMISGGAHKSESTCDVGPGVTRKTWRWGAISGSQTGNPLKGAAGTVDVCAWKLKSAALAHASYAAQIHTLKIKPPYHLINAATVGNESSLLDASQKGLAALAMLSRHNDTLVGVFAAGIGRPGLSVAQLVHLAKVINGRLK